MFLAGDAYSKSTFNRANSCTYSSGLITMSNCESFSVRSELEVLNIGFVSCDLFECESGLWDVPKIILSGIFIGIRDIETTILLCRLSVFLLL